MNLTKAQFRRAVGCDSDKELSDFLEISKQAISQQAENEEVPNAWLGRAVKKNPSVFDATPKKRKQAA